MKRVFPVLMTLVTLFMAAGCSKDKQGLSNNPQEGLTAESGASRVYYDFVISTAAGCDGYALTINDCGDASYKLWYSTTGCESRNLFNGTVSGSGNPLLLTNPATFPNVGATYNIFDNSTTATRDVLSVTFKPGYNSTHKPTISYNPSTRKFTVVSAGNATYITVSVFSYTGLIQSGVIEFC